MIDPSSEDWRTSLVSSSPVQEVVVHGTSIRKFLVLLAEFAIQEASAQAIDPEKHIQLNGHHSIKLGDDGATRFLTFTERANLSRIAELEGEIEKLPKHIEVQKACDFLRGGVKAKLIQDRKIELDVVLTNYGYSGKIIACVIKYMYKNMIGTQLVYTKKVAMECICSLSRTSEVTLA